MLENFDWLLLLFLVGLTVFLIYQAFSISYVIVKDVFLREIFLHFYLRKPLTPAEVYFLEKNFPYYTKLSARYKEDFSYRLKYFLSDKKFIGRQGLVITEEMRLMVGASAVLLTFGFQPLKLRSFNRIIIYPSHYYNKLTKRNHRGEVNSGGMIVFSWEDFKKGFEKNDGINLAYHELAHAVKLEDFLPNSEYAFIDSGALRHWLRLTEIEMRRVKNKENTFLRSYASANREEFFAVCVEQFFEQPEEFEKACPELFNTLADLLNQNPLKLK